MAKVKNGDTVKIHYRGTLEDGSEFDCSFEREPLEFEVGAGRVIKGFDVAVEGMEAGEEKTVTIPAVEAYGEASPENTAEIPKDQLPEGAEPVIGMQLQVMTPHGPMPVTLCEIKEETVVLDANHPLAGKDLTFELKLVEICS